MTDWRDNYIGEPNSGCWIWLGALRYDGYGFAYPYGRIGKAHPAHRLIYEFHKGPIPDGMCALHRCDNRCCCNPDHIFLGTQKENMEDKVRKGRCQDQRGEKGNNARLTADNVREIRLSNKRNCELAHQFKISPSHVSKLRSGKGW